MLYGNCDTTTSTLIFWIDSICIDQSNLAEKNVQVARMRKIYRTAAITACCLGPGRHLSAAQKLLGQSWKEVTTRDLRDERNSLKTLQQHPYFRRIWIKQELILSRHIRLFCGLDCIDWQDYEDICSAARQYDIQQAPRRSELHQNSRQLTDQEHRTIIAERRLRHSTIVPPASRENNSYPFAELWTLLQRFGAAECQDPHDRAYALLPLLSDDLSNRLEMTVAYEKPLLSLCLDLIRGYMRKFLDSLQPPHMFLVDTWFTMMYLIHNGFHLTLLDPHVAEFASQYHVRPELEQTIHLRRQIGTLHYVPADVLYRFTINGRIGNILPDSSKFDEDQATDAEDDDEAELMASISDTMPFRDTLGYLAAFEQRIGAPHPLFWDTGHAPFGGLSPELAVRIVVQHKPGGKYIHRSYLVSSTIEVGDEVLICVWLGVTTDRAFAPIVRPYLHLDRSPTLDAQAARYSFLIGWAIQLGNDGALVKNIDIPVMPVGSAVDAGLLEKIRTADGDVKANLSIGFLQGM